MKSSREIASTYRSIAKTKCSLSAGSAFLSAIYAGGFIALGAFGSQIVSCSIQDPGAARLAGALVFPVGLTMVLTVGTELFTGNNLMILPLLEHEISPKDVLKNWGIVYLGNLVGSLIIALLVAYSHLPSLFHGALAQTMITASLAKTSLSFSEALLRGILCNMLVCLAVWCAFSAQEQAGKVISLYLPTMLFVLCGFEHSIANMYFIPAGILTASAQGSAAGIALSDVLIRNLLPVTIGNLIGGAFIIGAGFFLLFGFHERS